MPLPVSFGARYTLVSTEVSYAARSLKRDDDAAFLGDEALVTPARRELREPDDALRERARFEIEGDVRVRDIVIVDVEERRNVAFACAPDGCTLHGPCSRKRPSTQGSISG